VSIASAKALGCKGDLAFTAWGSHDGHVRMCQRRIDKGWRYFCDLPKRSYIGTIAGIEHRYCCHDAGE
jgi:hypothetical protein